jgi:hypothetical protein
LDGLYHPFLSIWRNIDVLNKHTQRNVYIDAVIDARA